MINKPSNWDSVQTFSDRAKLPLGAYVCKVIQAKIVNTDSGDQLAVLFDIFEGDYSGFYRNDYESTLLEKKWRGVLKQWLPKNDGSEKDEWTKSSLKGLVTAFEKSNTGYVWNWDERTLKDKIIGVIFRNEEWEMNGKHGWSVKPFRACSVDTVRSGSFNLPEDKHLKTGYASSPASAADELTTITSDEIPF